MEKKINHLSSTLFELKEALEKENSLQELIFSEGTRTLESLMVEFELKRLLGEMGEAECKHKTEVLSEGLSTIRDSQISIFRGKSGLAKPTQTIFDSQASNITEVGATEKFSKESLKIVERRNSMNKQFSFRNRKRIMKHPPNLENHLNSGGHCMNPWKPECRNTDIELSIYYNGQATPICRSCWEEISRKNIEWSSF
jgi:hypothetical protein